jgi:hypothetical protein
VKLAHLLSGDECARLGWLFMLEGALDEAEQYARRGLTRSASNEYCRRLVDRIELARQRREVFPR